MWPGGEQRKYLKHKDTLLARCHGPLSTCASPTAAAAEASHCRWFRSVATRLSSHVAWDFDEPVMGLSQQNPRPQTMLQLVISNMHGGMRSNQRLRLPAATFPGGVMWRGVFENCHAGPGCQEIGPGIDRARALLEARATLSGLSAKSAGKLAGLARWFVIAPRLSHPQRLGTLTAPPKHSYKPCNNNTGTHPRPHHGGPTACPQLAVQCPDKCAPPNPHSRSRSLRLVPLGPKPR